MKINIVFIWIHIVKRFAKMNDVTKESPGSPVRSQTLYWLSYPAPTLYAVRRILLLNVYVFIEGLKLRLTRGSSVSIVSDCRLDDWGSIPGRGIGFFLQPVCPNQLWNPPSLLPNGYHGFLPCIKRPRHDADHSLPSSAEVMNAWELYFLPPLSPSWR
jgi:hypothetical protein